MKRRNDNFNRKRQINPDPDKDTLAFLKTHVGYGGNPEHKRDPGDFGLTPPSSPRPDKTLCDCIGIQSRRQAIRLLREGIEKGLISQQLRGCFPQNIWSVSKVGDPLEAQLENPETGVYHGYPMPETDPFRERVLECWNKAL